MQNHQAEGPLYVWPDVWSADLHLLIKSMVIHDTECPYWDQVSLNNTNQTKPYVVMYPHGPLQEEHSGHLQSCCSLTLWLMWWSSNCEKNYCRMLNVCEHLSWRFEYVWHSRCLNLVNVTSGVLFSYASIIFGESKEPHETRVIKLSWKLSILQ